MISVLGSEFRHDILIRIGRIGRGWGVRSRLIVRVRWLVLFDIHVALSIIQQLFDAISNLLFILVHARTSGFRLGHSLLALALVLFLHDIKDEFDGAARHVVDKSTPLAHLVTVPQYNVAERVVPFELYVVDHETIVKIAGELIVGRRVNSIQGRRTAIGCTCSSCSERSSAGCNVFAKCVAIWSPLVACNVPLKTIESCGQELASSRQRLRLAKE